MFNLVVSGLAGSFDDGRFEVDLRRVFEHTSSELRTSLGPITAEVLTKLMRYPTLFAYETSLATDARIGRIIRSRIFNGKVRVELEMLNDFAPIPFESFEQLEWDFDLGQLEMNRTHWALKEADLFRTLNQAGILSKQSSLKGRRLFNRAKNKPVTRTKKLSVSPRVFQIPTDDVDEQMVSVMMPFGKEFDGVYASIKFACETAGLVCKRADMFWQDEDLMQDVFALLFKSKIVVSDFSTRNPNVFYETGIAHTLGRVVIPIVQNTEDVPFDLRRYRHIQYQNNVEGLMELSSQLHIRLIGLR